MVGLILVIEWEPCDVYALTIPEDKEKCRSHSIYKLDDEVMIPLSSQRYKVCNIPFRSAAV